MSTVPAAALLILILFNGLIFFFARRLFEELKGQHSMEKTRLTDENESLRNRWNAAEELAKKCRDDFETLRNTCRQKQEENEYKNSERREASK